MANNTLAANVAQAISDFDDIAEAIENADVEVPDGTATSEYADKITDIRDKWEYMMTVGYTQYESLFSGNEKMVSSPKLRHTADITSLQYLFSGCNSLKNIPLFNSDNCENFEAMFSYCYEMTNFPDINTANGTNFKYMFAVCNHMQTAPNIDTSSGTSFYQMFSNCDALTTVPQLNLSNAGSEQDIEFMFWQCNLLENITFEGVIPFSFTLNNSRLTISSLLSALNALADNTQGTEPLCLTLGTANLNKLTEEQKFIALSKGWTLV